jgi:hypothetical protein
VAELAFPLRLARSIEVTGTSRFGPSTRRGGHFGAVSRASPGRTIEVMRVRSPIVIAYGLAGAIVVTVALVFFMSRSATSASGPPCRVVAGLTSYPLDREQVANAKVITETAAALGLPHHAVTVAVAAALQESRLHNLRNGDRDSLGLFQQRPSQGWGTAEQILDPRFASAAFFHALDRIDEWQAMSVNDAAQHVQRSATPTAYAASEREARAIARATTGEVQGALACTA